jgi:hypothetical protein
MPIKGGLPATSLAHQAGDKPAELSVILRAMRILRPLRRSGEPYSSRQRVHMRSRMFLVLSRRERALLLALIPSTRRSSPACACLQLCHLLSCSGSSPVAARLPGPPRPPGYRTGLFIPRCDIVLDTGISLPIKTSRTDRFSAR